jgi:hypothetical protein
MTTLQKKSLRLIFNANYNAHTSKMFELSKITKVKDIQDTNDTNAQIQTRQITNSFQ